MDRDRQKRFGAYYTPDEVAHSLVSWAVRSPSDRMLDPSCGDGRFLVIHPKSVGVEGDPVAARIVHTRAPGSLIHQGDFFSWAAKTTERFECAAGNPPFIRYQQFTGEIREAALSICRKHGAEFNALTSSWAPFLVATATLLKPGGQMAFVVPAEIGHAPYATPLLEYLVGNFATVQVVAIKEKLFPDLSEDCWLLFCSGHGGHTREILLSEIGEFDAMVKPPRRGRRVTTTQWKVACRRLRPFLLPDLALELYQSLAESAATCRMSDVARIGIGYVTGANDFFHLRPSIAECMGISDRFLLPAVRNGRDLANGSITKATVAKWRRNNQHNFLLRLKRDDSIPSGIKDYLNSRAGREASASYKCRNRKPWYVVPDVHVPDAFLSYMSGEAPSLVANSGGCVATNSVHVVRLKPGVALPTLQDNWQDPLTQLSCELEGHPLGGGMLKLEPGEAARVLIRRAAPMNRHERHILTEAVCTMRRWRHYA